MDERRPRKRDLRRDLSATAALAVAIGAFLLGNFWARNFIPQLGFVAFVIALLCAISGLWLACAAWGPVAMAALATVVPAYLPATSTVRPGCVITVVNFNKQENPPDDVGAARLLVELHPDIIFGEKVYGAQRFGQALIDQGLAGYSSFPAPGGVLILSRFPIQQTYTGLSTDSAGNAADILIEGRRVKLLNMYITRPNNNLALYHADYRALREQIRRADMPVILAGDGNATVHTPEVEQLRHLVHDAWDEKGFGLGATFPGPWRRTGMFGPWLRVDFIFHSDAFDTAAVRRLDDATGAGHYPIWAKLVLAGAGRTGEPCR